MSERYGTPGELKERFQELEGWLEDQLLEARNDLTSTQDVGFAKYCAGRADTLREVRDYILINPGG